MKTLLTLFILTCATIASGQNYSITSAKIAGGGGASSGTGAAGNFSVTGAIGQPDASAASSGGAYSISGGFFAQYMALQQTGAPKLIIRPGTGATVQVVWGANVPSWVLQTNSTGLAPESWVDVIGAPTVNGAEQFHQFSTGGGGRVFFRLRKL
jgi:hypothetical protein